MLWKVVLLCTLGIANVALFYQMMWGKQGLIAYQDLKSNYEQLESKIMRLDKDNRILSNDIRLLQSDDLFVEKMIREKLYYIKENEILYLFDDKISKQILGEGQDASKN